MADGSPERERERERAQREQRKPREQAVEAAPTAPASAATWLREQLLAIAAALYPDRRPVVVRAWTDAVRLREPEPVGRRDVLLVAVGGDDRPASPDLDDVLDAFTAAGWTTYRGSLDDPRGNRATARHEDFEVKVHEGKGPGLLTFTGWTPVVFTERRLGQPLFTLSTVGGVLCGDCHGWGVCLDCEGTGRSSDKGSWGRCWCVAGNSGPGRCVECRGLGQITSESPPWTRRGYGLPDPDSADEFRRPPVEDGHDSNIGALTDVAQRPCACGAFRCLWRNTLVEADSRLISWFVGTCQGCAAHRAYAFALPYRKLPVPAPPPSPPSCPRCGGTAAPLVGGLYFPGSAMMRAQELGLVVAGSRGCEVRPDDPNWRCASCAHDWRDADGRRRDRVLRSILTGMTAP